MKLSLPPLAVWGAFALPLLAQEGATTSSSSLEEGASAAAPAESAVALAPDQMAGFDADGRIQPLELPSDLLLTYDAGNPLAHLSPEWLQTWRDLNLSAAELMQQQRFSDASFVLGQALRLAPDEPGTLNSLGACYVQLRDFARATTQFEKILTHQPNNWQAKFNLAEMKFVTDDYAAALQQFESLAAIQVPEDQAATLDLITFKRYICLLMDDQDAAADTLIDEYGPYTTSPVWYMMNAAREFEAGHSKEASGWIESAGRVFRPAQLAIYLDSFVELGWIDTLQAS